VAFVPFLSLLIATGLILEILGVFPGEPSTYDLFSLTQDFLFTPLFSFLQVNSCAPIYVLPPFLIGYPGAFLFLLPPPFPNPTRSSGTAGLVNQT